LGEGDFTKEDGTLKNLAKVLNLYLGASANPEM
jgi:hypothetical protein